MRKLFRILTGYYRIVFCSPHPERLLGWTLKKNIPIWSSVCEENSLSFSVSPFHIRYLEEFFSHLQESESVTREKKGILRLFSLYGKRWGFGLGLVIFFFSLFLSRSLVWSVEVEGNQRVSEAEIREKLAEMGLCPGVFINRIDPATFSLQFQVDHKEYSYASLNIVGTRAVFTVREREEVEKGEVMYDGAANLVSDISGQIVRWEVLAGQVQVKRGEIVPKGALLISGIVEKEGGTFQTVQARGRVFAATERYFEVSIPFEEEKVHFTGQEKRERAYEILGFTFAGPGFDEEKFPAEEVVETVDRVRFLGRDLPILCRERNHLETAEEIRILTVDRAKEKAYDKYEEYKRDTFRPGFEIREEKVTLIPSETEITLKVEISAVEDIAETLPFTCF